MRGGNPPLLANLKEVNMTLEEFNTLTEQIKTEQTNLFNAATELFNSGEYKLSAYNKLGIKEPAYWHQESLLTQVVKESPCIYDMDLDYTLEVLTNFKVQYEAESQIGLSSSIDMYVDAGDGYVDYMHYGYSYYVLDINKLEPIINSKTRRIVEGFLKPDNVEHSIAPDCSVVQLFRDGAIDWETLQKITYKDCTL